MARALIRVYVSMYFTYASTRHHAYASESLLTGSLQHTQESQITNLLVAQHTPVVNPWQSQFDYGLAWSPRFPTLAKQSHIANLFIAPNPTRSRFFIRESLQTTNLLIAELTCQSPISKSLQIANLLILKLFR